MLRNVSEHIEANLVILGPRPKTLYTIPFYQKWPSRRSPNSLIKRLITIRQSRSRIVHFCEAARIASHTTFFTASSVGNTLRFLVTCRITLFSYSMALIV